MNQLGQDPSEAELIEMINSVDDNGDNEIDFAEFLVLMKSRIGERDPEKELRDAFAVFDSDGSGSIDRSELKILMANLGQRLTDTELDDMMDEVDTDGDGEISFEEFKAMMVRLELLNTYLHCAFPGSQTHRHYLSAMRTERSIGEEFNVLQPAITCNSNGNNNPSFFLLGDVYTRKKMLEWSDPSPFPDASNPF